MSGLCDALEEHEAEIRADFRQFYNGLDLADIWRGTLSVSYALLLLEGLAYVPESRYRAAALGTTDFIGWDRVSSLLADILDALQANTVVTAKTGGGKPKTPDPYKRPEPVKRGRDVIPSDQELTIDNFPIMAMIGAMGVIQSKK